MVGRNAVKIAGKSVPVDETSECKWSRYASYAMSTGNAFGVVSDAWDRFQTLFHIHM